MATGGGWQSETFDTGRGIHHATQEPPMASATPPAMYNPSPAGVSKESSAFGVIALSVRIAQILFTLIAFSVMASNKETNHSSDLNTSDLDTSNLDTSDLYTGEFKFSSVKAFVGVLSVTCIVCVYAIVQLVLCFVNMSTKGSFISSATAGFAMLTFLFDMVLAYTLIAAAAAGADSVSILTELGICDAVTKYCRKAQASVAMSFFAFALLAVSAALYPVRLLRLTKA